MTDAYNYRVTNTSDETHMMEDKDRVRRFNPGASKKTHEKPDGRETWYELEKLNPDVDDIENTADLPENEDDEEESDEEQK